MTAVNSRLLVRRQKMHTSQKCCGELVELKVDDIWQIADAGDQKLWRLAHSSEPGTSELGPEDNDGILQNASTAFAELYAATNHYPCSLIRFTYVILLLLCLTFLYVQFYSSEFVCCRFSAVMPLVTPKRAIKAIFVISAIGFIVVDVSILLREDDVSASTIVNAVDARIQQKLDLAVHNFSVGASGNFIHRERSRLLHQMANASRRNHTNSSHPTNRLPRVSHMSGNLSEIRAAMLAANRQQNIANLDIFDLVASDSAIVIVVQVHNRVEYLRHLVSSLRKAVDIEQSLLVFSHDFYSDELNDIVASIDFCPVCSSSSSSSSSRTYRLTWHKIQ